MISTEVRVFNKKQANGAGRVRELIDEKFGEYEDWVQSKSGDIDWVKRFPGRIVVKLSDKGKKNLKTLKT